MSLDGARAETHDGIRGRSGAWRRAMDALAMVAGLDFAPRNRTALTSVNTRNLGQLEALGRLLSERFPGIRWQLNLCSAEAPRLPEELSRFGGILKETSADKEGEKEDRLFLEVAYYTPLAGSL